MDTWYKIEINGGTGFMRVTDGEFIGYYDEAGNVIQANDGTSVRVTENDVQGPI